MSRKEPEVFGKKRKNLFKKSKLVKSLLVIVKIFVFILVFSYIARFLFGNYIKYHNEAFSLPSFDSYLWMNFITGIDKLHHTHITYSQYRGTFNVYVGFLTKQKTKIDTPSA